MAGPDAPLVGREHELDLLLDALRASRERPPALATLVGVPGIGKSRLVTEFGRQAPATRSHHGARDAASRTARASPTGRSARSSRRRRASSRTTRPPPRRPGACGRRRRPRGERRWVEPTCEPSSGSRRRTWVSGSPSGALRRRGGCSSRGSPPAPARRRVRRPAVGRRRPPRFRRRARRLVEGVPLFVVCCARPELLERRPDWGGGKRNALTVSLGPLSVGETEHLVESLLGRDPADDDIRRGWSNAPRGTRSTPRSSSGCRRRGRRRGVPDSVLGIVTARVDLLPPEEKELLRDAAVMGASSGRTAPRRLRAATSMTSAELCGRSGARSSCVASAARPSRGRRQHAFVHALVATPCTRSSPSRPGRATRAGRGSIESLPEDRREDRAERSPTTTSRRSGWPAAPAWTRPSSSLRPARRSASPACGVRDRRLSAASPSCAPGCGRIDRRRSRPARCAPSARPSWFARARGGAEASDGVRADRRGRATAEAARGRRLDLSPLALAARRRQGPAEGGRSLELVERCLTDGRARACSRRLPGSRCSRATRTRRSPTAERGDRLAEAVRCADAPGAQRSSPGRPRSANVGDLRANVVEDLDEAHAASRCRA